ncbi:MAG: DNA/RNA non-specific endonuclease [Bacteroidales bacterium]|nr:DNA/RNA non-specific endonuclease [Bacteroidales bacterium]
MNRFSIIAASLISLSLLCLCTPKNQGGSDDPVGGDDNTFKVGTVLSKDASDISTSSAKLNGEISDFGDAPRELGFEWGFSSSRLDQTIQSADILSSGSGSFSATVDGLDQNTEVFYRAYAMFWVDGKGTYYYGDTKSFKTEKIADKPSGIIPAWYEVPSTDAKKDGSYITDASNSDYYYTYHMCQGGEKGPGGKTARNYTLCYSASKHCPVWVAAPRHSMYVGSSGRNDSYRQDPTIPSDIQYTAKSTGGGCNKGHMLGSAERTSSVATNKDVFYYPNIAPQLSSGFNTGGGGWNNLEDWVDEQVCSDTLYVVIGCFFDKFTDGYGYTVNPEVISYCGRDDVAKPTMFYYILMRTKNGSSGKALKDCSADEIKCAAFVRAHTNSLKGQKVSSKEMMSVSELEKLTGFSYFPNVPNAPKNSFKASEWGL